MLSERLFFLTKFGFVYTGSDEMIFWQAATDYMNGIFHEPFFYGQNYNFMLEALVAVPFLKLGIPYHYTFPIVSSILALFPFIFFATILYKKSYYIESFVFLIIPLTMPVEYNILTSITRGFVSGLFFTGFLIYPLLYPTKKISYFMSGICIALGYIFNPNSLVFSIPIGMFLLLNNFKTPLFYIINILCAALILYLQFLSQQFYVNHPDYNVCGMWSLKYSFNLLLDDIKHLDTIFTYLNPIIWNWGWLSLIILLIAGIYLLKNNRQYGISIITGIIFIIFTLGINKVNDGINIIFFSIPRMFLGIPLFLSLGFFYCKIFLPVTDNFWKHSLILIGVIFFFIKISISPLIIKEHTSHEISSCILEKKISALCEECDNISSISNSYDIELIIFLPDWKYNVPYMEFYNYGCPLIEKNFKKTLLRVYEKRTWVYLEEKKSIRKNILLYGYADRNLLSENTCFEIISDNPQITVIKNNILNTEDLLKKLNITLKRNAY